MVLTIHLNINMTGILNQSQAILKEFYLIRYSQVFIYLNADIRIAEYMNYNIGFPDNKDYKYLNIGVYEDRF